MALSPWYSETETDTVALKSTSSSVCLFPRGCLGRWHLVDGQECRAITGLSRYSPSAFLPRWNSWANERRNSRNPVDIPRACPVRANRPHHHPAERSNRRSSQQKSLIFSRPISSHRASSRLPRYQPSISNHHPRSFYPPISIPDSWTRGELSLASKRIADNVRASISGSAGCATRGKNVRCRRETSIKSATVATGCVTVKVSAVCAGVALGSVIRVALRTSRSHRDRINRRVIGDVIAVN